MFPYGCLHLNASSEAGVMVPTAGQHLVWPQLWNITECIWCGDAYGLNVQKKVSFLHWLVIWLSLSTKDAITGTGGCSLSRKQAGSVSCGASLRGRNTGSLPRDTVFTFTVRCTIIGILEFIKWHVTPVDPAVEAVGSQSPSEACGSLHWHLQSPELPARPARCLTFLQK